MVGAVCDRSWRQPLSALLIVLIAVFVSEYAVHLGLRSLLQEQPTQLIEATADAMALTLVVSPLLWWRIVRPLREVIRLRSSFLADLFTRLEGDRKQVAHDLHDGVGQSLSLLVSGLRTAGETARDPADAARCEELQRLAQMALADVKRLALGLRPSLLDDLGLTPALERVVADVRQLHPIAVTFDASSLDGRRLDVGIETAAFRIVQEALANVVRHSGATQAAVTLRVSEKELQIAVADNGRGIKSADVDGHAGHLGLTGMRERAEVLGGTLVVDSPPGQGTRLMATIPLKG